jgi:hypothetical protein
MAKLEKAIITKKIVRPYSGVQEPEVGMTGHIIEHEDTPVKHTCIRFLAKTLGYSYDPEYDDAHRKYVRIFVPNNNFEIVQPGAKKTKTSTKEKALVKEKTTKMKQPQIMMNLGGGWQSLPGHGCYNQKEMEEYVRELDPNGSMLKVMDLAEVKNDTKPTKKKM